MMANLNNPNILKFYNWHETRNHLWLIFEYCIGGDLYHLLEQDRKLPESSIKHMGLELITGLYYLHSKGIVYAELKPSNVIIDEYSKLKLCDFGLARKVDSSDTELKQQSGTPSYMAPELFTKQGVYSYASDLWSLGCVLFEMASGKPPFSSSSLKELVNQIIDAPTPRLDSFSSKFNDLIRGLLDKDPIKRFTWEIVRKHPFWEEQLPETTLPPQPQFEAYLRTRGINPSKLEEVKDTTEIAKKGGDGKREVDFLRMSQTIKKNIRNDNHEYHNEESSADTNDVHLVSKDQELNFSEKVEDDEEKLPSDKTPTDLDAESKDIAPQLEGISSGISSARILNKNNRGAGRTIKKAAEDEDLTFKKAMIPASAPISVASSEINSTEEIPKPLDQLMIHTTDMTVNPIIRNKDIEKPLDLNYRADRLPFTAWRPEIFSDNVDTIEFERHIAEISRTMIGPSGIHVLAYFEAMIQNTNVANKLINSNFVVHLAKVLVSLKSNSLKTRICSVIGTLVRHATVIENEVAESGICQSLQEMLKEKQEAVRRKGIAALGEYLFYAATQMDDEEASTAWTISPETVSIIIKCLKPTEDEIVRFYACKTVENISSQSISAGCLFANVDVSTLLLNILTNGKNEKMKLSAAIALSHICKLNSELFPIFFDFIDFPNFCNFLTEGLSRLKQAFITLFLYAAKNTYELIEKMQIHNPTVLVPAISNLLESSNSIIKGKVLLAIAILIENNILWLPLLGAKGAYHPIDRIAKDSNKYLKSCHTLLCDTVEKYVGAMFSLTMEELVIKASGKHSKSLVDSDPLFLLLAKSTPSLFPRTNSPFYKPLSLLNIFKSISSSVTLKPRIITSEAVKALSEAFGMSEGKEFEEVQFAILGIFESLTDVPKLLPNYCEPVIRHLLPTLLNKIYSKNEEMRCVCFKIVYDIFSQYMTNGKYLCIFTLAFTIRGILPPLPQKL